MRKAKHSNSTLTPLYLNPLNIDEIESLLQNSVSLAKNSCEFLAGSYTETEHGLKGFNFQSVESEPFSD
ncbi:MAG: hypothetical protein U0176_26250, partial [Bacteroidia bacterium]